MSLTRQQAFQRLRPPCVELSSVALKFKTNQASPKAVLLALENVHRNLQSLGESNLLDAKLAEYAFFPLTHIFNQSQKLSSRGLELAVECVQILVRKGWRESLVPEMAKQLLILLSLLVTRNPKLQVEPATDELKVASFDCMGALIRYSASTTSEFLESLTGKNIADQLVYQLLEAFTDAASEDVQISAARALLELVRVLRNRALLASLLPRTVSTLVKVLRPSTQAKRTRKVLVAYLKLLTETVRSVLADTVIAEEMAAAGRIKSSATPRPDHGVVLDQAWLDATAPQIDLALVQVVKLKNHEGGDVAEALLNLCLMIIDDCSKTLARSMPLMVETLLALSTTDPRAKANLKHFLVASPQTADILGAKFYEWSQALPRVMQGNDDRPKKLLLQQVATSFVVLAEPSSIPTQATSTIASVLVDTVAAAIGSTPNGSKLVRETTRIAPADLLRQAKLSDKDFMPVLLSHQSQAASTTELKHLIASLKAQAFVPSITRNLVDYLHNPDAGRKLAAAWLALQFLRSDTSSQTFDMLDFIDSGSSVSELSTSRPFLISDLYSNTVPILTQFPDMAGEEAENWRMLAVSLECLVLQASQLGEAYRPELVETLFPLLTMLGSNNAQLQQHAMVALDLLATACQYDSAAEMLIENVDYLINAVALRLDAFDVSRNSLQVINMMLQLCGARILPHLDDLIGSIFSALDSFHGHPGLVEQLFEVLKMVVTESSETPAVLAIEEKPTTVRKQNNPHLPSSLENILNDLRARKARKRKSDEDHEVIRTAPRQPWGKPKDESVNAENNDLAELNEDGEEDEIQEPAPKEKEAKLSKAHQLLLKIGEFTVPHMSSPSPQVRLTLLELIEEICPLLAPHENSFLPLINAVWPAVVSKLLRRDQTAAADMAYNTRAAAVTIGVICRSAGDFMASRIEDIFPDLENLFKKTYASAVRPAKGSKSITSFGGSVDVAMVSTDDSAVPSPGGLMPGSQSSNSYTEIARTSSGQLLEAFIDLLLIILRNVRMSPDNEDRAFVLLGPMMSRKAVRDTLLACNDDVVWTIEHNRD